MINIVGKPTAIVKPCNPVISESRFGGPFEPSPNLDIQEPDEVLKASCEISKSLSKETCNKQETFEDLKPQEITTSIQKETDILLSSATQKGSETAELDIGLSVHNSPFLENTTMHDEGNLKKYEID